MRRRIDLHRAGQPADALEKLPRDLADGAVGRQRDASSATVAVFDECLMAAQVKRDDERAGPVWRRQRRGLPSAGRQAQRGVL